MKQEFEKIQYNLVLITGLQWFIKCKYRKIRENEKVVVAIKKNIQIKE